jgi:hypothetical protein
VKRTARTGLIAAAVIVGGALLATGAMRLAERQKTATQITALREELYRARVGSDRCRNSLVNSEASLRHLSLTIDSMRSRVDSFEALDGRGVPVRRYEEYLEAFDSYNDSVAAWEVRERRLRTAEVSCRSTIEEHNELSDSLQGILESAGIEAS